MEKNIRHTSSAIWYLQFVFIFFGLCEIFNRWDSGNRMGLKYIASTFDSLWMVVIWKPGYWEVSWMEAIHQGKSYSVKMPFNIRRKNNCIYAGNYYAALLQCLSCAGEPSAWPQHLVGCQQRQAAARNPSPRAIPACFWLGLSCKAAFSSRDSSIITFPCQSLS